MSATLTPPRPAPVSTRLLTAADLAALPTSLPSGDVRYELDDGVLVTMPPPGDIHAVRQASVIYHLFSAQLAGLGEARGEVGIVLRRDPDRVVGADAAFILTASLPVRRTPEGWLETIPEIVIEIRSKNDTRPGIVNKADEYFRAGVQEVWVLDSDATAMELHAADGSVRMFRAADTFASDRLPGWSVAVTQFFVGG
ncbi:MAG: Uma2 family endonuclease [Fimbriiglobus sp.]|jgi:Uma2 family endonuclease|nr:Uma2 family endonuclease [Fimbriiglobus sp.]